ncbi:STAS domain-containing protein [soil metagenome]
MSDFSVSFSREAHPHTTVLSLRGELDAHTAPELEVAFEKCLEDGSPLVIVDGAELKYISSAGLGVFMAFLEPIREAGGDLKIAALQPRVFDVFDLLGFPMLFDVQPSVSAAAERFDANELGPVSFGA